MAWRVLAPAKLNLFLEVLGRRPDGYHEIETVMVAVSLYDTLTFTDDPSGEISLRCNDPALPVGSDNLVVKAAERLKASTGFSRGSGDRAGQGDPGPSGAGWRFERRGGDARGLDRLWDLEPAGERLDALAGGDRQRRGLLHAWSGRGLPRAGRAGGVQSL